VPDGGAREVDSAGGVVELDCKRCGPFRYGGGAWEELKKAPENKRAVIASRLWDQNRFGSVPTIDESNVDALLSMRPRHHLVVIPMGGKNSKIAN
jgi:hypothetical protein